jgi:hypothetical protein
MHEPPRTYGSPHGFGNVLFPGTGHAPGTYSPFSIVDPTFGSRLSSTVSGFGYPYRGYYRSSYGYGGGAVVVPYAVPVYVPYVEPQPQVHLAPPPQVIYVVPGAPERSMTTTAPAGIVTYVVPSKSDTNEPKSDSGEDAKRFYLIALRNYSIYTATEYWLEGDTLHYVTHYGAHNQASLDQVDLDLTHRLNRERGLDFRLRQQR